MELDFQYTVIRRPKRKTAAISIKDGQVTLSVPQRYPDKLILELIRRKADWIKTKLKFNLEIRPQFKPREYVTGEAFAYLGKSYCLKVSKCLCSGGQAWLVIFIYTGRRCFFDILF